METILNNSRKLDEIIFENKNKMYGAYALRKNYRDNLSIALLFTASFFGLLVFLAVFFGKGKELIELPSIEIITDIWEGTEIEIEKPKDIEKPPIEPETKSNPPVSQSGALIASDNNRDSLNVTNEQFVISKTHNTIPSDSSSGTIKIVVPPIKADDEKEVVKYPDDLPSFKNLNEFIQNNLRYPADAKYNKTEGKLFISFIVEIDGTVSEVKALNNLGDGCDKEAIRVVKLMKGWKPGIFKGKERRVPVTLPILFRLE